MNQWLRHYTCGGFCKTSYHLLISPPPTNLPNTIDRQDRQYRCYFSHHYTRYFPANGSTNPDVFQPKTFSIPKGIIPQNFRSLGFAVSEEQGTSKQTHSLTDWCFDREINNNKWNMIDFQFQSASSLKERLTKFTVSLLLFLKLDNLILDPQYYEFQRVNC